MDDMKRTVENARDDLAKVADDIEAGNTGLAWSLLDEVVGDLSNVLRRLGMSRTSTTAQAGAARILSRLRRTTVRKADG